MVSPPQGGAIAVVPASLRRDNHRHQELKMDHAPTDRLKTKLEIWSDYAFAAVTTPVLLVSGFWRSGTTWALETFSRLLQAKSIFEPFHPYVQEYSAIVGNKHAAYMPSFTPSIAAFLTRAMRGAVGSAWVRTSRHSILESCRTRSVAKLVRGQFCLPSLTRRLGIPIVHIRRSPYAVMASILRGTWGEWMWDIDLAHVLPERVRQLYYTQIEQSRSEHWLVRVVLLWAISEQFVCDSDVITLSYEDLCLRPEYFSTFLRHQGYYIEDVDNLTEPSVMTSHSRHSIPLLTRLRSWEYELNNDQKRTIARVLATVGVQIPPSPNYH